MKFSLWGSREPHEQHKEKTWGSEVGGRVEIAVISTDGSAISWPGYLFYHLFLVVFKPITLVFIYDKDVKDEPIVITLLISFVVSIALVQYCSF